MRMLAVYKGDEPVMVGTMREVCQRMGWKPSTVHWLATPSNRNRGHGNRTVVVKVEV